ncbi:B-box type zinc finger protein with CCT domain [Euphorbia peplus]|nr:B-box type zinc finger protein with CCT domain [Euphorbia peplus]
MKNNSSLRSPKKEEQQVPQTNSSDFIMDEYELENLCKDENEIYESLSWDFFEFDETTPDYSFREEEEEEDRRSFMFINDDNLVIKKETTSNLNLNLNYEEVLDAWCDRSPLLPNDFSPSINGYYMGEVPIMEEERSRRRREASVLRYKEKRQTRLFSKKIRYHVRKLNADQRPRLKGRFVKRDS